MVPTTYQNNPVAPSRVRGLKLKAVTNLKTDFESHPHGCVD